MEPRQMEIKKMKYANHIGYSDVHPYEVVRVVSDKTIEIRPMNVEQDPSWKPEIIAGGFSGHCVNNSEQRWIITSDEEAETVRIRYSKKYSYTERCGHNDFKPTEVHVFADKYGRRYRSADQPCYHYDYNF